MRSQHKILVLFENFRTDLLTCNTPWPQVQEFWPFFFVNMEPLNHFLLHVWGLQSWSLMAVQWAGNEIFAVNQLSSFSKLWVSARPKFVSFICRCKVQSKDVNIHHVKAELKVKFYLARTFEAWLMDPTCWNLRNYFTTSLWSHSYVLGDYSQIE